MRGGWKKTHRLRRRAIAARRAEEVERAVVAGRRFVAPGRRCSPFGILDVSVLEALRALASRTHGCLEQEKYERRFQEAYQHVVSQIDPARAERRAHDLYMAQSVDWVMEAANIGKCPGKDGIVLECWRWVSNDVLSAIAEAFAKRFLAFSLNPSGDT